MFMVQVRLEALSALFFGTFVTTYRPTRVKFTLEQAIKAQRWNKGRASLTASLDGVGGQRHAPTAVPLEKRPSTHCTRGGIGPTAGLDRR